ncbi:unnamed protein product, partial [Rotaria sordida]
MPTFRSIDSRSSLIQNTPDGANEEITRLHQPYAQLLQTNRNQLSRLISIENDNTTKLYESSLNQQAENSS